MVRGGTLSPWQTKRLEIRRKKIGLEINRILIKPPFLIFKSEPAAGLVHLYILDSHLLPINPINSTLFVIAVARKSSAGTNQIKYAEEEGKVGRDEGEIKMEMEE